MRKRKRFYLVACSATKGATPAPARDLYTSALFRKSRALAERRADAWFVLSAEHYLLDPDEVIEPYEKTLKGLSRERLRHWAAYVTHQLGEAGLRPGDTVVILAGANYRGELTPMLKERGAAVVAPLAGLGIGRQLALLKNAMKLEVRK